MSLEVEETEPDLSVMRESIDVLRQAGVKVGGGGGGGRERREEEEGGGGRREEEGGVERRRGEKEGG